jgi:hypothetical protein
MSKDDPQTSSEAPPLATRRGQALAVCLVVVVGLLAAIGVAVTRAEDATSSPPSTGAPAGGDTTTTTAVSKELVIETRLREILKVRDRALLARNAGLLGEIYTTDCKCLKDGRALIRQLRKESRLERREYEGRYSGDRGSKRTPLDGRCDCGDSACADRNGVRGVGTDCAGRAQPRTICFGETPRRTGMAIGSCEFLQLEEY